MDYLLERWKELDEAGKDKWRLRILACIGLVAFLIYTCCSPLGRGFLSDLAILWSYCYSPGMTAFLVLAFVFVFYMCKVLPQMSPSWCEKHGFDESACKWAWHFTIAILLLFCSLPLILLFAFRTPHR